MKKILITGANSYIGTSVEKWLMKEPDKYKVDTIDMKDVSWKEKDFSKYDVVFHVAGIAHVSSKTNMKDLYYKINRDLAILTARKAKQEGVKQLIFMSSIIVYGNSSCRKKIINIDTLPKPSNFYGDSKLQAEKGINLLNDKNFQVVIVRSPMVYGKNSKGNYPLLSQIVQRIPIFPDIENERSVLYIENLCEFIKLMIDNKETGIFFPQNKEYAKISDMVRLIGEANGKKIIMTKIFNPIILILCPILRIISKIFGNLVYEKSISIYKDEYNIRDFNESILCTENKKI